MADSVKKISGLAPANRQTANILFGEFVHWLPRLSADTRHYSAPPVTRKFPGPPEDNMTGRRFGRLLVIGYLRRGRGYRPRALWLVRCSCGQYEERHAKACRNPDNYLDRCNACRQLAQIRRNEHFCRTGKQMSDAEAYA